MHHVLIGVALLSFLALDLIFVNYSGTSSAALAFALLSYAILLLLSASAGNLADPTSDYKNPMESQGVPGPVRPVLAAIIPVSLLLILAFIRGLDSLIDPQEAVRLGSTFAVFWLLTALALVGAVLGFMWPRTGALESVVAGGLVVLAQSLLSRVTVAADRESLQLALYTWMVWITVCLIGAWVGMVMRQTIEYHWSQGDQAETIFSPQHDVAGTGEAEWEEDAGSQAPPEAPSSEDGPGENRPADPE